MRFLRMFTNSLLGGGLAAAYLTVLVFQLNPDLPLVSLTTARWYLTLGLTYGVLVAVVFYLAIVLRELVSAEPLSPGWVSVRVLAWLSAACAAAAAALMWTNASAFRTALGEIAARRLMAGAFATALAALVLTGIAIAHYSYGRRGSRVGGALFAIATIGSLALPVAARGPAVMRPEPIAWPGEYPAVIQRASTPRVVMLLLDGASLEYIRTRSAEGRFPHFSRVLDEGASMYLATVRPTQPAPVWAAAATGMLPAKNGVRSDSMYYAHGDGRPVSLLPAHCFSHVLVRIGAVHRDAHTSAAWHARPLWSILSRAGISSGVVRWPLTYPARPVLGFLVPDRFDDLYAADGTVAHEAVHPEAVLADVRRSLEDVDRSEPGPEAWRDDSVRRDRLYARLLRDLAARHRPAVAAVRLQSLDVAGHHHYDDRGSRLFRDANEADRRLHALQLERAYAQVDDELGRLLEGLAPTDLVLVISGFGMERPGPLKQALTRLTGTPVLRGIHEDAPDGFVMAYGAAIQHGRLPRGSIVDVTPTVLYFLGVPIGRDMDGFVRTDLFTVDFIADRPIAFIGSHR